MSDAVDVVIEPNGFAQIRLFGANVALNPVQLANLRAALLPAEAETPEKPEIETPETPASKPEKRAATRKKG